MKDNVLESRDNNGSKLSNFNWEDPLLFESLINENERLLRDGAKAFADEKLMPKIVNSYDREHFEPNLFREMGDMGLLGVTIPEEYGGLNANYVSYGLIAREIERVDSGYRSMLSVQSSLVMYPIFAYGNEAQKQK